MTDLGMIELGGTLYGTFATKNGSLVPVNADSLPSYRIYGSTGLMANGTGSASFRDSGSITGATNANPIVISSAGHGLSNGNKVTITGVSGNTAANTTAVVANVASNTFELSGVVGNGAYTSGGTWNVSGLYKLSQAITSGNGYASGSTYYLVVTYAISSTTYTDIYCFTVA